jgi:hypothetical protein
MSEVLLHDTDISGSSRKYLDRNVVDNDQGDQIILAVVVIDSVGEVAGIFGEEVCVSGHGGRNELETTCCRKRQKMKDISFVRPPIF